VFIRVHLRPFLFCLVSIVLFWGPLNQWVSLSLADHRYSHIILIPVISVCVMYLELRRIFSRIAFRPGQDCLT